MKQKLIITTLLISNLYSQELLNEYKLKEINLNKEQIKEKNIKEKLDLVSPINLSYSKSQTETDSITTDSEYFQTSFNQEIFRSGAIWKSIKYGNILEEINLKELSTKEKNMKLSIYKIAKNISINDLEMTKTKLSLKNKEIEYLEKLNEFRSGMAKSTDINRLIIDKLNLKNNLIDRHRTKINNKILLKEYTDINYKDISEIKYIFPNINQFIKTNIVNLDKKRITTKQLEKDIVMSNYLPKLSVNGSYTKQLNDTDIESTNIGLKISIPLHPNSKYNNQLKKIEILKAKNLYNENIHKQKLLYEKIKHEHTTLENKVKNTKEIVLNFNELLNETIDLYKNGFKTREDVQVLENSKKIYELDVSLLKLRQDLLVLDLHKNLM